jgi:hypothetical protein
MDADDDWHWRGAADESDLREDERETFELLRQLKETLGGLIRRKPPYARLEPPERLQVRPSRPIRLIARESETFDGLCTEIHKLEDLLSQRYGPTELGEHGTITYVLGRRSFYRGFLDKRRTVPLLRRSSPDVVAFLQKVPKFGDHLKRENHAHFGIHYHYLDSSKRRSDTVLCFKPSVHWPLFAEKHAERHAHFPARPRGWSADRRRAIYHVLNSEKAKFKQSEFRRPSSDSALVWQENAVLLRETRSKTLEIVLSDKNVVALA